MDLSAWPTGDQLGNVKSQVETQRGTRTLSNTENLITENVITADLTVGNATALSPTISSRSMPVVAEKALEETGSMPSSDAMFTVEVDHFLGPIDLLLHLVKKNELEIEKISLAYVADQYVECLQNMRSVDLEIAGEYLVIASTLLSIKSSVLLQEPVELELDEEGNLVDPHEELLLRLKEASIYLEGAAMLEDLPMYGREVFAPVSTISDLPTPPDSYRAHDPYLLGVAFKKLLEKRGEEEVRYQITLDSVSIVDQMMGVLELLKNAKAPMTFESLVTGTASGAHLQRAYIVGTFIALLELSKRQVLLVQQDEDEITVALKGQRDDEEIVAVSETMSRMVFSSEFDEVADESVEGHGRESVENNTVVQLAVGSNAAGR